MASNMYIPIAFKSDPRGLKKAEGSLKGFGKSVAKIGGLVAGAFAVGAVVSFGKEALKAAAESQAVTKTLGNAVKNAKAFGKTAGDIGKVTEALDKQSTALSNLTGVDDEFINKLKTGWLTVPNIVKLGTEGLNKLATVSLDVAAATGKGAESVAKAFSRAFSDPEGAVKKLQKAGVFLTESQAKTYDSILKTNGAVDAQKWLLDELAKKYEGAAQAAANPFERLKVVFDNLKETVGAALLPAFTKLVDGITPLIETIAPILADIFGAMSPVFDSIKKVLPQVADAFKRLNEPLKKLFEFVGKLIEKAMPLFVKLFNLLLPIIEKLLPPLLELLDAILDPLIELIGDIIDAFQPLLDELLPVLVDLIKAITPGMGVWLKILFKIIGMTLKLAIAFNPLVNFILPLLAKLLEKNQPLFEKIAEVMEKVMLRALENLEPALDRFLQWATDTEERLKPLYSWLKDVGDMLGVLFGWNNKTLTVSAKTTAAPTKGGGQSAGGNTHVTINASSVDTSANTGRAIAKALGNFYSMNNYAGLKGKYNY